MIINTTLWSWVTFWLWAVLRGIFSSHYFPILHIIHKWKVKVLITQLHPALYDPMDITHQGPLFMEFSRVPGVGCHFLVQGIFLTQGSNLGLFTFWATREATKHNSKNSTVTKSCTFLNSKILYNWTADVCSERVWYFKNLCVKDFLESSGVKTLPSKAEDVGLIPGRGAKIPHASQPKIQNIKQKQCCSKFNKDFKNGPHPKKKKI